MPFTLSHAVVALPLRHTAFIPSAIAIGAMVPDLPLFFPLWPVHDAYGVTHSWWGVPTVDLVLAAAVLIAWWTILRPAVTALSPRWLRSRFPGNWARMRHPVVDLHPRAVGMLVASLVFGSGTHVVWDLFTHPARAGSEWFPLLARMWGPLAGYDWLQYVSSILGIAFLAIWAISWLRGRGGSMNRSRMPLPLVSGIWAIAVLAPGLLTVFDIASHGVPASLSGFVFRVGVPAIAIEFVLLILSSIALVILEGLRHARDASKFAPHPPTT